MTVRSTHLHPTASLTLLVGALLALVAFPTAGQAQTSVSAKGRCLPDADGDGYPAVLSSADRFALSSAPRTTFDWRAASAACGPGMAEDRFAYDCDDDDASVHPRRKEMSNGIDDNCNGQVDEPEFRWPRRLSQADHTDDSITLQVKTLDQEVLDRFYGGEALVALVHYRPIHDEQWQTRYFNLEDEFLSKWIPLELVVDGLEPGTVHAFRVQFGSFGFFSSELVGDESDHFFAITTDSESDLSGNVRAELVTTALYEFHRSNSGYVGYMGRSSRDGSDSAWGAGYGAQVALADGSSAGFERWCSEFYASILGAQVESTPRLSKPVNGVPVDTDTEIHATNIGHLVNRWFDHERFEGNSYVGCGPSARNCGSGTRRWAELYLRYVARPGDYAHTSGHSTMVLGYDAANNVVWVVDGNGGFPAHGFTGQATPRALTAPPSDGNSVLVWDSNVVSVRAIPLSSFIGWGGVLEEMTEVGL